MATKMVRIDPEVLAALNKRRRSTGVDVSYMVSSACAQWLREQGVNIEYPRLEESEVA